MVPVAHAVSSLRFRDPFSRVPASFITLAHSTISIRKSPAPAALFRQTEGSSLCKRTPLLFRFHILLSTPRSLCCLCRALSTFVVDGIVTGEQDLRNRYDLIPLGKQVVENIRQRLGRVLARIVEQHDRPALHLACHALCDLTRRDALPVEGIPTGSTWKRLSCLASWPPLTVFFPPIHSPPLNMPRINSILVKCVHQTHSRNCCRRIAAAVL